MAHPYTHEQILAAILSRFEPEPNSGCWLWTGHLNENGYGRITIRGRNHFAHRVAYQLFRGPIPTTLILDHLCRTRSCMNPDHLEAVTRGENVLRGVGIPAIHAKKTHCPQGHPYSGENLGIRTKGRNARYCKACDHSKSALRRSLRRHAEPMKFGTFDSYIKKLLTPEEFSDVLFDAMDINSPVTYHAPEDAYRTLYEEWEHAKGTAEANSAAGLAFAARLEEANQRIREYEYEWEMACERERYANQQAVVESTKAIRLKYALRRYGSHKVACHYRCQDGCVVKSELYSPLIAHSKCTLGCTCGLDAELEVK